MEYNLEGRTKNFSKEIIILIQTVERDELNKNIISQLIRSATSIGANYMEANGASSKRDFRNKIAICRKEAQETKYWIELLAHVNQNIIKSLRKQWKEAHELTLIFNKIFYSLKNTN